MSVYPINPLRWEEHRLNSFRTNPKNRQEDVHFERCINHGEGERIKERGGRRRKKMVSDWLAQKASSVIVHQLQRKENGKKILLKVCRDLSEDNEVARRCGSLGGGCKKILWDSFGKSKEGQGWKIFGGILTKLVQYLNTSDLME